MNKGLLTVRRVATGIWLGVCGLQFVIWLLICLIGWHLANPFWLWTAAVGGVIVGGLWAVPAKDGARR
jgi:hypothetical protein